jgi:mRNA interferase RelE/StbE
LSEDRTYQVLLESAAQKQLRGFDPPWRRRIIGKLEELGRQPRGTDGVKLAGGENLYRVRVGDVRIVYAIQRIQYIGRALDASLLTTPPHQRPCLH